MLTLSLWPERLQRFPHLLARITAVVAGARFSPVVAPVTTLASGITLPVQQARTVHLRRGDVLTVSAGQLWLTRPGVAQDQFLQAGGRFVAHLDEPSVVLECLGEVDCVYQVGRLRYSDPHV